MRPYELSLSRHDHHNLELKSAFQLDSGVVQGELDVFLFLPSTMQLHSWSKQELTHDFRSRVRISVPSEAQNDLAASEKLRQKLSSLLAEGSESTSEIFSISRQLGALFGEALKHRGAEHRRELFMVHSLLGAPENPSKHLEDLATAVLGVREAVDRLRALIEGPSAKSFTIFGLLDQYVDHLYTQYIASMRAEYDRLSAIPGRFPKETYEPGRSALGAVLRKLQSDEAERTRERPGSLHFFDSDEERERYLHRLGQLKKFFQSEMFVDVTRVETIKKISEPVAAGTAAFAALWALVFQQMANRPNLVSVGFQGIFFICAGMAFYVLRDRLKDRGRDYVTKHASRYLPDIEQELIAEGRKMGTVKEWFSVQKSANLTQPIRDMRARASLTEAEKHLPEEVLHYRRKFTLKSGAGVGSSDAKLALQGILRINVERYLKHMDDPYKEVSVLSPDGNFSSLMSHRVYHFNLGLQLTVKTEHGSARPLTPDRWIYRVVMDKNGIDRVEAVP